MDLDLTTFTLKKEPVVPLAMLIYSEVSMVFKMKQKL